MNRFVVLLFLITCGLLFLMADAAAEEASPTPSGNQEPREVPEHLRLSPEQRTRIKQIREKYTVQYAELECELRDVNHAIYAELEKDQPIEIKLVKLRQQRVGLLEKYQRLIKRMRSEIDSLLTDAQRKYYENEGFDIFSIPSSIGFSTCPYANQD